MDTSTIVITIAGAFLVLLPVLKVAAKKTDTVLDDKILTLLWLIAKKIVRKL